MKQQIIKKLKELREDVYNHSLIDKINIIVWDNIDDGQYGNNYDRANYISNQLGSIKCSIDIAEQYESEGDEYFANLHFNDAEWNIQCLISFVESNLN